MPVALTATYMLNFNSGSPHRVVPSIHQRGGIRFPKPPRLAGPVYGSSTIDKYIGISLPPALHIFIASLD
jgi:hypothetical protein